MSYIYIYICVCVFYIYMHINIYIYASVCVVCLCVCNIRYIQIINTTPSLGLNLGANFLSQWDTLTIHPSHLQQALTHESSWTELA